MSGRRVAQLVAAAAEKVSSGRGYCVFVVCSACHTKAVGFAWLSLFAAMFHSQKLTQLLAAAAEKVSSRMRYVVFVVCGACQANAVDDASVIGRELGSGARQQWCNPPWFSVGCDLVIAR